MNTFSAELIDKKMVSPQTMFTRFQTEERLAFKPGQFIAVHVETEKRYYSLASSPLLPNQFDLLSDISHGGIGGQYLQNLNIHATISFIGPFGNFILQNSKLPKLFLATGVGISPIRGMIQTLALQQYQNHFILLWGVSYEKDLFFLNEWEKISAQNKNFSVHYVLSKENKTPNFHYGHIQDAVIPLLQNLKIAPQDLEYYICGRVSNVQTVTAYLQENLQVSPARIFFEKFV